MDLQETWDRLLRYARLVWPDEPEDLVQEVFCWNIERNVDVNAQTLSWFKRKMYYLAIDWSRRRSRRLVLLPTETLEHMARDKGDDRSAETGKESLLRLKERLTIERLKARVKARVKATVNRTLV
jgi:DNA-directed RNA polymerase specialized sigma24 family protein